MSHGENSELCSQVSAVYEEQKDSNKHEFITGVMAYACEDSGIIREVIEAC